MNGNDDLISVVVPAHNAERFIAEALASVQAQSHRNLEVVVVDDGSTDRTAEIVEAIASRDGRVRLIGTPRRGVSAARNLAIARARGDLIAPLDADDLWLPQKLARQYAKLGASSSEVGVVYCWSCGIDANGLVIMPSWGRGTACGDVLEEAIVQGVLGHSGTPLIRRTAFDETGGTTRASASAKIGSSPSPLRAYAISPSCPSICTHTASPIRTRRWATAGKKRSKR